MSEAGALDDAYLAVRLLAIDPVGLGGIILRGGGEARDAVLDVLRASMPEGSPERRLPTHIDDERLLGGLDLTATLATGRTVSRAGVLVEADGGLVVVPMAERMADGIASRIAAVLDNGAVEGAAAQFALVLLDDGIEADERPPVGLAERLAFHVKLLEGRAYEPTPLGDPTFPTEVAPPSESVLSALVGTAEALGIESARAPIFALRAARASAMLAGRETIIEDDVIIAARLVLGPRATRFPQAAPEEQPAEEPPPPPPETEGAGEEQKEPGPMEDVVLEAVLASLPKDVLAKIASGGGRRTAVNRARGAGERRRSSQRGRPLGARAGTPGGGLRLSLIDTLRAAAPWQKLRGGGVGQVRIRCDDLRIRRFETRAEATTIFAVDASGSSAVARLAEAKGAVELLLAEAYVKRAQVALVAFRGTSAEILLAPTRSLARARRSLGDLPGGGGTPLAAGLTAAHDLAQATKARGRTPFIVVLTDGRANIAADGSMVREVAQNDAEAAARIIGQSGFASAFVDISSRPRSEGAELAALMGARYLPLPRADAAKMHAAVVAAQKG